MNVVQIKNSTIYAPLKLSGHKLKLTTTIKPNNPAVCTCIKMFESAWQCVFGCVFRDQSGYIPALWGLIPALRRDERRALLSHAPHPLSPPPPSWMLSSLLTAFQSLTLSFFSRLEIYLWTIRSLTCWYIHCSICWKHSLWSLFMIINVCYSVQITH